MDRDQAAAILGTAHDAYFDVPCEVCEGSGVLEEWFGEPPVSSVDRRQCPTCDGSGETGMPHPDQILRAANVLVLT